MSFITDLGKGFIRSAVNQVGRDGGKVISNHLYGNAHSTPIRNVGISDSGKYFNTETDEEINVDHLEGIAETDGWIAVYSSLGGWGIKIFWALVSILPAIILFPWSLLIPIVPIYIIYRGVKKIRSNEITYQRESYSTIQKSDRRYKSGYRTEGKGKSIEQMKLPCTKEQSSKLKLMGWTYIIIAILLYIAAYFAGESYQKYDTEQSLKRKYEMFLKDAEWKESNIEQTLRLSNDTIKYKKEMEDFKQKYKEASEYLKSN